MGGCGDGDGGEGGRWGWGGGGLISISHQLNTLRDSQLASPAYGEFMDSPVKRSGRFDYPRYFTLLLTPLPPSPPASADARGMANQ